VGEHEDRAVVVGQGVAELTGELEGGVFALAAAEELVGVFYTAVAVEDVVAWVSNHFWGLTLTFDW